MHAPSVSSHTRSQRKDIQRIRMRLTYNLCWRSCTCLSLSLHIYKKYDQTYIYSHIKFDRTLTIWDRGIPWCWMKSVWQSTLKLLWSLFMRRSLIPGSTPWK